MGTRDSVILVAPPEDLHALAVARELGQLNIRCHHVDSSLFPSTVRLAGRTSGGRTFVSLAIGDDVLLQDRLLGVWRRRVLRHVVDPELNASAQELSRRDTYEALSGFFMALALDPFVNVINNPLTESRGLNKVAQLSAAGRHGLAVPETVVTNDPRLVIEFFDSMEHAGKSMVCKGFTSPKATMIQTRMFTQDDLERLPELRFMPAIFQEYVHGRNLRITVVGDCVFSAEVLVSIADAEIDWRLEAYNRVVEYPLPDGQSEMIAGFVKDLGLTYGALDFKLTEAGELVFLEVNPWGQYLFVEIQTGQRISHAIAANLASQH